MNLTKLGPSVLVAALALLAGLPTESVSVVRKATKKAVTKSKVVAQASSPASTSVPPVIASPTPTPASSTKPPTALVDLQNTLTPGFAYTTPAYLLGARLSFTAPQGATSAFVGGHLQISGGTGLLGVFADAAASLVPESASVRPETTTTGVRPMPENFLSWVTSIEGISVVGATRDTVIDARPARLLIAKLATLPATSTQNSAVYMLTFHDYGDGVLLAEISLGATLQFIQFDLPNGRRVIGAVTNDSAGTALLQSIRVA